MNLSVGSSVRTAQPKSHHLSTHTCITPSTCMTCFTQKHCTLRYFETQHAVMGGHLGNSLAPKASLVLIVLVIGNGRCPGDYQLWTCSSMALTHTCGIMHQIPARNCAWWDMVQHTAKRHCAWWADKPDHSRVRVLYVSTPASLVRLCAHGHGQPVHATEAGAMLFSALCLSPHGHGQPVHATNVKAMLSLNTQVPGARGLRMCHALRYCARQCYDCLQPAGRCSGARRCAAQVLGYAFRCLHARQAHRKTVQCSAVPTQPALPQCNLPPAPVRPDLPHAGLDLRTHVQNNTYNVTTKMRSYMLIGAVR